MCPVKEGLPCSKVSKSLTSSVALLRLPLRNKQCPGNFLLPHCAAATAAAASSTQIYKVAKGSQQQPFLISFVALFTRHKHTRAQINTRTHTHTNTYILALTCCCWCRWYRYLFAKSNFMALLLSTRLRRRRCAIVDIDIDISGAYDSDSNKPGPRSDWPPILNLHAASLCLSPSLSSPPHKPLLYMLSCCSTRSC